jgi:hypothetical protein
MNARCVIGWPRWTDVVTWSGGTWETDYPRTNLGVLPLARVARSDDATTASTQFLATLDKQRPVRLMALVRHNISLVGRVRIRLYGDTGETDLLLDTGWENVWPEVYPYETLEWEDDSWWTGTYTAEEIAGYQPTRPFWFEQFFLARAIRVEIDDTTNAAGYIQIGMCEISQGWQPSFNFSYGYQEGFRFRTQETEALGGVKTFDRRDKPRVAQGEIQLLPQDEALARGFELFRQADTDQPFLWLPAPDEQIHWLRRVMLARAVNPGLITYSVFARNTVPFNFEEVL